MNFGLESFRFKDRPFLGLFLIVFRLVFILCLFAHHQALNFTLALCKTDIGSSVQAGTTTFATELPAAIWASAAENNVSQRSDKGTARTCTRSASGPSIKANQAISPKFPRGGVPNNDSVTSTPMVGSR